MKRKITALLLAAALIFALLPTLTSLADAASTSGSCGNKATWKYDTGSQTLTISGSGNIASYKLESDDSVTAATNAPWRKYRQLIKKLVISEGITGTGEYAFAGCSNLSSVTMPNSLVKIGPYTFGNCESLSSVNIPSSVKTIGNQAFTVCGLKSITIPGSVTDIGNYAFSSCSELTDVLIPSNVKSIGSGAFSACTKLKSVTISEGVSTIGNSAFSACSSLKSIKIPKSVTSIGNYVFSRSSNLTEILVENGNKYYKSLNGVLYSADGIELICYPIGKNGSFTIPSGVKYIAAGAFTDCKGLTSISIPESLTSIGDTAFANCNQLSAISLPKGVNSLGKDAFSGCTALKSIKLPSGLQKINSRLFNECINLSDVTIPDSVTKIDYQAFFGCLQLKKVQIPKSVVSIGSNALGYYWNNKTNRAEAMEGFTIAGYSDTEAAKYAAKNGFTFIAIGTDVQPDTPPMQFNDIPGNAWYIDAVNYAVSNGLMNGISSDKFAPDNTMTRSMLVTVLWRYAGKPAQGSSSFTDVPRGIWYEQAVAWASSNGIVNGIGGGKFNPDGNITREQLSAILYRFAQNRGSYTGARGDLSAFPDCGSVSDWAKDAMNWAVGAGLINGSDGKLLPQGNATRAQVAAILMRYIENIAK